MLDHDLQRSRRDTVRPGIRYSIDFCNYAMIDIDRFTDVYDVRDRWDAPIATERSVSIL